MRQLSHEEYVKPAWQSPDTSNRGGARPAFRLVDPLAPKIMEGHKLYKTNEPKKKVYPKKHPMEEFFNRFDRSKDFVINTAELRTAFNFIDKNNDNHIAAKELFWATASVFERLCKETNFKRLVKRKKSSKSVYARYPFSQNKKSSKAKKKQRSDKSVKKLKKKRVQRPTGLKYIKNYPFFSEFDRNLDGFISEDEFISLFNIENDRLPFTTFSYLFQGMASQVCQDPRIYAGSTWSTYAANVYSEAVVHADEIEIFFYRNMDINQDGFIRQEEWTKLFKKIDVNRNKALTKREFEALDMKEGCFQVAVNAYKDKQAKKHRNEGRRLRFIKGDLAEAYTRVRQMAQSRSKQKTISRTPAQNGFELVDMNRSGKITSSEFFKEFQRLDTNQSKQISIKEYTKWFKQNYRTVCKPLKKIIKATIRKIDEHHQEQREREAREKRQEKLDMERATKEVLGQAIRRRFRDPLKGQAKEFRIREKRVQRGPYSFTMPKGNEICKDWEKIVKSKRVGGQQTTLENLQNSFMEEFTDDCSNNYSQIYMSLESSVTGVGEKRLEVNQMLELILEFIEEKGISLVRSPDMNANHLNKKYLDWVKSGSDSDKKFDFPMTFDQLLNDRCSDEKVTSYELLFKLEQLYKVRAHNYLEEKIPTPRNQRFVSGQCPISTQATLKRILSMIEYNHREETSLRNLQPFLEKTMLWLEAEYGEQ